MARLRVRVFVISLKGAAERRASAAEQFGDVDLPFTFFDAVESVDNVTRHFSNIDRRRYRLNTLREPLAGEIGCYASHLALWKTSVVMNQSIVVLEDDFQIDAGFPDAIPLIHTLADDYGFIRLETFKRNRNILKRFRPAAYQCQSFQESELYYVSDVPLCALAYAISPTAARSLIRGSRTMFAPVDKFLQHTWVHNTPVYALSPALVSVASCAARTTIGVRPRKSLNPFLRLGRALYKVLGEISRIGFDMKQLKNLRSREPPRCSVTSRTSRCIIR